MNRWKLNKTGIHRSIPALATIGPDGAYSLVSCDDEKNRAMPFNCSVTFLDVTGEFGGLFFPLASIISLLLVLFDFLPLRPRHLLQNHFEFVLRLVVTVLVFMLISSSAEVEVREVVNGTISVSMVCSES